MLFQQDPLQAYHTQLRASAPAGYPNQQFYAPNPYAMSMAHQRQPSSLQAWQWGRGHGQRARYGGAQPNYISSGSNWGMQQKLGRKMSLYMRQRNQTRPLGGRSPIRPDGPPAGTPHQYHGYGPQRIERIF